MKYLKMSDLKFAEQFKFVRGKKVYYFGYYSERYGLYVYQDYYGKEYTTEINTDVIFVKEANYGTNER